MKKYYIVEHDAGQLHIKAILSIDAEELVSIKDYVYSTSQPDVECIRTNIDAKAEVVAFKVKGPEEHIHYAISLVFCANFVGSVILLKSSELSEYDSIEAAEVRYKLI